MFNVGADPDVVYVLLEGTVRVFHRAEDGREVVVKLLAAPAVFGDIEVISKVPFLESVAALDAALIAEIPGDEYRTLLESNPAAMRAQLDHACAKFCVSIRNEQQNFASLEQRIANILLSYCDVFGQRHGSQILIEHPLSQRDIALSLAVVPRSVAYVLARWNKSGLLKKQGSRFVVRAPEKLEELAAPIRHGIAYRMGQSLDQLQRPRQSDAARLEFLQWSGDPRRRIVELGAQLVLGSRSPSDLLLPSRDVAGMHCRIFRGATGPRYWIADLGSQSGTWLNGKRVMRAVLRPDDIIRVGAIELRFELRRSADGKFS